MYSHPRLLRGLPICSLHDANTRRQRCLHIVWGVISTSYGDPLGLLTQDGSGDRDHLKGRLFDEHAIDE